MKVILEIHLNLLIYRKHIQSLSAMTQLPIRAKKQLLQTVTSFTAPRHRGGGGSIPNSLIWHLKNRFKWSELYIYTYILKKKRKVCFLDITSV